MPDAPAIVATRLVRHYGGAKALDGLDLTVPAGSVFGLLGPNGSGKSTFLALVAGSAAADSGSLAVLGETPTRETRRRIGIVFQENTTDPLMSPLETLVLAGRLYGLSSSAGRERARALLDSVGLRERANDAVATLSGGMRRRVELARSLMHRPQLLLLDEPTTGVDPDERRAFWAALRKGDRQAETVVLATNDLGEADAVCDEVAFMRNGCVVAHGTPAGLKDGLEAATVRITFTGEVPGLLEPLIKLEGVASAVADGHEVRITTRDPSAVIPHLFALGIGDIAGVRVTSTTLEDAYFAAIGRRAGGGG